MYTTWVLGLPSGHERGDFLTVDLGGTNLRVCWISLSEGKGDTKVDQEQYSLPEDLKTGKAEELWIFLAKSMQTFIKKKQLPGTQDNPIRLGFTFSYPAIQNSIDSGKLQTWTKGFDIKGVEGEDVASQLRTAIEEHKLPVKLVAIINDTTGALIASAYNDPDTIIGAIFGTGCNAAYMDKIGNIPKLQNNQDVKDLDASTPMAINCEYGAFDNSRTVLPFTRYDKQIDEESPRPGEQAFEKMSAGLYLGEIYRLIIIELHSKGLFLQDQNVSKIEEPYCMDTAFLSGIENDTSDKLSQTATKFENDYSVKISEQELVFSRLVAKMVATRGARLCACGVAAICLNNNLTKGHIAADGSVANKHPTFKKRWGRALADILDWDENRVEDPIVMTSAEDGSGIGAAVIAAMTLERWDKGQRAGIRNL